MNCLIHTPITYCRTLFRFSKEDSAILKGAGILFMIFHHCFGLYSLPENVDTNWVSPVITGEFANSFKICVEIFIFITGYALCINSQQIVGGGGSSLVDYIKTGIKHYSRFWKTYVLCLSVVLLLTHFLPTPMLSSTEQFGWKAWLLLFTGFKGYFYDWWYMGLFAFGTLLLSPICAFLSDRFSLVRTLSILLTVTLIFSLFSEQLSHWTPFAEEVLRWSTLFIFGYFLALLAKADRISGKEERKCFVLLLAETMLICYCSCFNRDTPLQAFMLLSSLWILPDVVRRLKLTRILCFLGTYSALMWLNHRFIFGYYFSEQLYATHSYILVYSVTVLGSLLLAVITQFLFSALFRLFDSTPRKLQA